MKFLIINTKEIKLKSGSALCVKREPGTEGL